MTTMAQVKGEQHTLAKATTFSDGAAEGDRAPLGADPAPEKVTIHVIGDRILRITLSPGGRITEADGARVRERFLTLTAGAGGAVLLQITGVRSVSRDAVEVLSRAATVTAFAILGSTPVDRVIAHGMHGLPQPQCPSRYFSDEQEAMEWLNAHRG
ncbi:hypothetical protein J7I84_16665 [Arthrobacter sp. ISL-85]|uniref:DUF7793 family protein n=1 Tax=Arthrobacter sp. ISL-85 TaxID=2819115 RepID=UPI001BE516F5|nr:hypothetical protein [Arthrobacter sp. ISL-85]MBT2568100.1 hypothetical protein [Arthrobacter sp. ISL-85]